MPSLRKRVSSYLRQLSFHNEPRDKHVNFIENTFINKYLHGEITVREGPTIHNGKMPTDLPSYDLGAYKTGFDTIIGCFSGPDGGLTAVKRKEKHLSLGENDIDFIDTQDDQPEVEVIKQTAKELLAMQPTTTRTLDNSTMVIKMAGQEYFVTNRHKQRSHSKSHSLGSLKDFDIVIDKTKCYRNNNNETIMSDRNTKSIRNDDCDTKIERRCDNNNISIKQDAIENRADDNNCNQELQFVDDDDVQPENNSSRREVIKSDQEQLKSEKGMKDVGRGALRIKMAEKEKQIEDNGKQGNYGLAKSKSEGNPFRQNPERAKLREGRIRQLAERPSSANVTSQQQAIQTGQRFDPKLPPEWNRKSEFVYGISDSLYDRNLSTKVKNGNPIADCFGILTRSDSAILAVADGVNWGEKAAIAAKSAVHGCLHYLNKTIFLDTRPFDKLINKSGDGSSSESKETPIHENRTSNTKDVFVCLLRAFNCAHDLILENNGMLTTLTVAIVLPLKDTSAGSHVVCVCNVGDSLAYVYSQHHGIRELTKGSHDITSNRDMRDALGALGPVDGIKPELSNLTLSVTTLQTGDIVIVASDGLTDNFDPTVCKFAVNSEVSKRKPSTNTPSTSSSNSQAPQKPPRKNSKKIHSDIIRSSPSTSSSNNARQNNNDATKSKTLENRTSAHNPLVAQFLKDNPIQKSSSASSTKPLGEHLKKGSNAPKGFALLRSKTALDFRTQSQKTIPRNPDGLPYITPVQKYEITLLMIEDILKKGISGKEHQTVTAKKLCENLVSFTMSITNAKRRTLEDNDLYFNNQNGVLIEASNQEKKMRRKRALERVQNLPGKLDHVTVVACNVGNRCYSNI